MKHNTTKPQCFIRYGFNFCCWNNRKKILPSLDVVKGERCLVPLAPRMTRTGKTWETEVRRIDLFRTSIPSLQCRLQYVCEPCKKRHLNLPYFPSSPLTERQYITLEHPPNSKTLHCPLLHCAKMHCTSLYCTALSFTALHCSSLYCTELHCTAFPWSELYCTISHLYESLPDIYISYLR